MVTGRRDGSLRRHFTTSFGRNGHAWPARSSPPFPRLRLRYNAIFRSLHNKTNHTFLPLFHVSHFFLSCYALEFPRCVMYLGIFSHSIISKLLKRALLYTNSFVCTFVVFDESLVQTVCQKLLSKSTEIIRIPSFTSCGVPRCLTSMPLFHLSVPRPCTSVSLSIVQLRRSEELANNMDHRRSDEITARRKQHPCSRVLQRPPQNKKRGAAAGTPWRIARSFRRERRHCFTVGATLTVSIAIVEKSQGGSGMKSFTVRTRLVD